MQLLQIKHRYIQAVLFEYEAKSIFAFVEAEGVRATWAVCRSLSYHAVSANHLRFTQRLIHDGRVGRRFAMTVA